MALPRSAGDFTVRAPAVERAELVGRRALAARDDGAGMAHALARGAVTPAM
jgi:hypothetical protein